MRPATPARVEAAGSSTGRSGRRRHPADIVRVGLAAVLLIATGALARYTKLGGLERDTFRVVNDLPGWLSLPIQVVMQAGALGAVPAVAGMALVARRRRLARDLAMTGPTAWMLAKAVKLAVDRGRPVSLLPFVVLRGAGAGGRGFPSGHVAVAAALAGAASPYLNPRARRLAWVVVPAVGLARIYVGAHLPVDVIGGAALGWGVAAAVHLLLGVEDVGEDAASIIGAFERIGTPLASVAPAGVDARGSVPFS